MIIEPKIRGFLCTTTHPIGCEAAVKEQIRYVKSKGPIPRGPKKALIIGSSAGYGLSSRIAAAFGNGAATLGLAFERPPEKGRMGSPGWYQTRAFDRAAHEAGLWSKSLNGDAFSEDMKNQAVALLKEIGPVDLVVYSLAAPRRTDPKTGEVYKSTLKPIGKSYTNKTLDFNNGAVTQVTLEPASEEEVRHTVGVMGGDDWMLWMDRLRDEGLLAPGCLALAYSYIGPKVTQPVYRNGTIGTAKDHLEKTARKLDERMQATGGRAFISVNKALVTQASSAIPFMPLYISLLYKVMKEKGIHEGCLEQMDRLFRTKLYTGQPIPVDNENRIRMDDWELSDEVQGAVEKMWVTVDTGNGGQMADIAGYRGDFHRLYGFAYPGVDYSADVPDSVIFDP
jgi:enoyl-[acyl-carrier protein] reductase/trans-2-enoyl-CoA reductase (NAD+)